MTRYRITSYNVCYTKLLRLIGSLANGLMSAALALVGLYFVSSMLNIPTSFKVLELSQPNHPYRLTLAQKIFIGNLLLLIIPQLGLIIGVTAYSEEIRNNFV